MTVEQERPASVEPKEAARIPTEGHVAAPDGFRIFVRRVLPDRKVAAKGAVLVVHGFAEHSGRYGHVLSALAARGFDAWALDLRGHGRSQGGRGCIDRFEDYLVDVETILGDMARGALSSKFFLIGHSMGGLVSTRFLQERQGHKVLGLLLSSPFFRVKMPVPAIKRGAASVLSRVLPSLGLPAGLDANGLSRDPEVVRAYVEDPLVFTSATSRWFTETMKAQALAFEKAPSFELPALVLHGALDPLVDPEATGELFAKLGSPDKTLKLWPGLRHEIVNEPEKGEVIALMLEWIEKHLPA